MSYSPYHGRISGVNFSLSGTNTVLRDSFVPITSPDLFRNGLPYPGGACDAHTGTSAYEYKCETCYQGKRMCLGHEGHIKLNYPVWNPMAISDMRKWLKLICFECGNPILEDSAFMHFPKSKRLDEASKLARTNKKRCFYCKELHPMIRKDKIEPLALVEVSDNGEKYIYPHMVKDILSKISNSTVTKLGKHITSHPKNFVLDAIKVPPVTIRPDVKKMGGGRSTNDDLTTMIQVIIKKNDILPNIIPIDISRDKKLEKAIHELNNAYYDFVKAGGDGSMNSLALRLKGKKGRARKTQLGKRVYDMCRSTIVSNSKLKIDEVGIPLSFARTMQIEETVQEYNRRRLLVYVQNGRKRYPGATEIYKRGTNIPYDVDLVKDIELEVGDRVMRDMIDGDPANFNRQPSLKPSNIATHKVVVMTDPKIKVLMMNVIICPYYDADFDGDAMNLIINSQLGARIEIAMLSSVPNWMVSHSNSSMQIGQVDDTVIGLAETTRSGVMHDKYHAMTLFRHTTVLPHFEDNLISGRDCVSELLTSTPINFTRVPSWYRREITPYMKYDPDEIRVEIDHGKLKKGILDKKSIGKGAAGGIYHIICNDYGPNKALEVMHNMQQLAIAFIIRRGFTIGIKDLIIPKETKIEIDKISSDIINKSRLITEELHNGEIVSPIGKSIEAFYEEKQIGQLREAEEFLEPIVTAINPNTNNLFKLILSESKGKMPELLNMTSSIGPKVINQERIKQKFGYKRTLPYFPRFDTSPESRGYILNSYLAGMTSVEYIFNAMAARFDLITKALSTSITGEQMRKSIKNLESTIINNYRMAVKNRNIIQLAYGEDFLDARKVERVKFPTIMISDAELEKQYFHKSFPNEFKTIKEDREKYRNIFLKIEQNSIRELISDERHMPVAIGRIIGDTIREFGTKAEPTSDELRDMVTAVNILCESIPYVLINEIQAELKTPIPEHIKSACWLLCALIRSYLHPNAFIAKRINPHILKIIIDKIRVKYAQALIEPGTATGIIAAQSFSAPLTQYMLDAHHRSTSGGTTKSGMSRVREILGAKDVSELQNPSMLIPVLSEYAHDKAKVQEIANHIEVMQLKRFVTLWEIYYEKYGEPVHSRTKHEVADILAFAKVNPLLKPPGDLVRWCIRIILNKTTLIVKNMSLELIINKLREAIPDIYIVYTPENSSTLILRVYMRNVLFRNIITTDDIKNIKNTLMNVVIRGVSGIINTEVNEILRNEITADGSIKRVEKKYAITTTGTNLAGVLKLKYVDKYHVQTDAIPEIMRIFGIEAARRKIASELQMIVEGGNHRHYMGYADEMTFTGRITSIERSGLKTRENSNVLLQVGASSPLAALEEAAVNSVRDEITGLTARLLIGDVPQMGTNYNSFHVNKEFVKKNIQKPDDILKSLFDY